MATIARIPIEPVHWHGGEIIQLRLPEAASQTFVKGEIVYLVGGYITEIAGNTPSQIAGVAMEDAHNDTSSGTHNILISTADAHNVFVGSVTTNGSDVVTAVTDVGGTFGIYRDTTNSKVYIDKNVTAGASVRTVVIEHYKNPDVVGDTNGRVYFRFISKYNQLGSTS